MHKTALTLTIVIPVYNEELYLPGCLDAISKQVVPPTHIIVVDNNSSDKTAKIAGKYKNVQIIRENKIGVIHARDAGFNAVTTDIIARIDADTLVGSSWVQTILDIFSNSKVDAVTGPVGLYDVPFAGLSHLVDHFMRKYVYLFGTKHDKPFLSGPNMALRTATWKKVRASACRDQLTHEDIDLAVHIVQAKGKIQYTPKLRAYVSSRRYNDKYQDFRTYMQMFDYTYRCHDLHGFRVNSASAIYWIGYYLIHPLRKILAITYKLTNPRRPFETMPRKNPN